MRLYASMVLLLSIQIAACEHRRPGPWVIQGGTPVDERQALAIADAARRVYVGTALDNGGTITLAAPVGELCFGWSGRDRPISGCTTQGGVIVLWPHPKCPPDADLSCSALAHELAHVAFAQTEAAADAGSLLIITEYRRVEQR